MRPLVWTALAGVTGLLSSGVLSSLLRLGRPSFVLGHAVLVLGFVTLYCRSAGVSPLVQIRRRWLSGTVGGLAFGIILIRGVVQQPRSAAPHDGELGLALVWLGGIYGLADALLLTVVPVLSVYGSRGSEGLRSFGDRFRWGLAALGASLLVTAVYHLGFAEYRGASIVQPLIGNAIVAAGYLLTGSPLAPIIAHVMMHGAAVMHGPETTLQLPPHY